MKKSLKRILAIICCVAVVLTGISVDNLFDKGVQAADASATSVMSLNIESVNNLLAMATGGFLNIPYTGVASDYAGSGSNFLDAAFAEKYITFGGGMTYKDLSEGLQSFYVANNSVLQMNWANRTSAFTEGWSFTIAQGALLPYRSANGTAYMALDREYTFTFADREGGGNLVQLKAYYVTSFGMTVDTEYGSGSSANASTVFHFADAATNEIKDYRTKYTYVYNDSAYADYIDISGYDFSELESASLKLRYILDNGTECFQFEGWGDARNTLTIGDQIILREGLPIYYIGTNGYNYKALLDETYVYECVGSNAQHNQIFVGMKYDSTKNVFGINTNANGVTTVAQSATNPEQYINIGFDSNSQNTITDTTATINILGEMIAEEYIQIADYTVEEVRALGMTFRFIPSANVLQLGFGEAAVDALEVGDQIILKAGLPVVYKVSGSKLSSATLDNNYAITVLENNGTNLTLEYVLTDTYGLSGAASKGSDDGYASTGYVNMFFNEEIPAGESFQEIIKDAKGNANSDNLLKEGYFTITDYTYDDLKSAITLKAFNISALRGFRFVYTVSGVTFEDGDVAMWKAGLPISYNVSAGGTTKQKTIYLDKDYGFVYKGASASFEYDSSLVSGPEETPPEVTPPEVTPPEVTPPEETVEYALDTVQFGTGKSTGSDANSIIKILDPQTGANNLLNDANRTYAPLSSEVIANYVDVCGLTAEEIQNCGMSFRFIRDGGTQVLQILWGTSASELEIGSYLKFKQGLPFTYTTTDGSPKTVVLDKDYVFEATGGNPNHTRVFNYVTTTTVTRKEWTLENGAIYNTARGAVEGYYNNISLGTSELTEDLQSLNVILDAATLAEYVDFAGIEPSRYGELGIQAIVVIAGNTKVVQLRWGETTSLVEAGDEIIFKKGMPITVSQNGEKTVYELDADYVFTISKHTDGANGYRITTSKIDDFNVVITVDGVEVLNGLYRTGTELDLEQYRNTAAGKVMSIQVNGVATQNTSLVVSEDTNVVILNRSDICIVVFKDEGVVVATREYVLTDENIKIPFAPDKDGYDDSWEEFKLVNGVIEVNAVHTLKASTTPSIKLSGVVIEETNKPADDSSATSPQTGDASTTTAWIVVSVVAMMFVILKLAEKNKARRER